jgi:hypothetical protein
LAGHFFRADRRRAADRRGRYRKRKAAGRIGDHLHAHIVGLWSVLLTLPSVVETVTVEPGVAPLPSNFVPLGVSGVSACMRVNE